MLITMYPRFHHLQYRTCQILFLLASLLACPALFAQTIALTFDDGPRLNATPLLSPDGDFEINDLAKKGIQ